jgi:hypothetical protein
MVEKKIFKKIAIYTVLSIGVIALGYYVAGPIIYNYIIGL